MPALDPKFHFRIALFAAGFATSFAIAFAAPELARARHQQPQAAGVALRLVVVPPGLSI